MKDLGLVLGVVLVTAACGGTAAEEAMRSQKEYELAVGLMNEQNLPGAFDHLFKAVELDPDNAEAHLLLGNLFMMRREDARAEHHLRESLRLREVAHGPTADAHNSLGVLYIHAGRYDDAIRELRKAAGDLTNREPHLAFGNLGWAYQKKGAYRDAVQALQQSVTRQPRFCVGFLRLGETYLAMGDSTRAEQALTQCLEVDDPQCQALQEAWHLRGQARARLGHREDAVADFERCVELEAQSDTGRACRRFLEAGH